jgi:hypothetical protein
MRQLADEHAAVRRELAKTKEALSAERARGKVLIRVVTELTIEFEQARKELADAAGVTRLPGARTTR